MATTPNVSETRVPCSCATREQLRSAKRGGETYDELFRELLEQYDPDDRENGA
jgi:hypothetical protein